MSHNVKKNHPRSTFYFYASGQELSDDVLRRMEELLTELASSRNWLLGPPLLADELDGNVRMIGGTFDLYTAIAPFGADLPKEVDRQHLDEVTAIIDALIPFSKETNLEINCALDQTFVGCIDDGLPDKLLTVGLLGEWRKAHGQS
jgi:hypothetical protein